MVFKTNTVSQDSRTMGAHMVQMVLIRGLAAGNFFSVFILALQSEKA